MLICSRLLSMLSYCYKLLNTNFLFIKQLYKSNITLMIVLLVGILGCDYVIIQDIKNSTIACMIIILRYNSSDKISLLLMKYIKTIKNKMFYMTFY